jgi:hypothetical protein
MRFSEYANEFQQVSIQLLSDATHLLPSLDFYCNKWASLFSTMQDHLKKCYDGWVVERDGRTIESSSNEYMKLWITDCINIVVMIADQISSVFNGID